MDMDNIYRVRQRSLAYRTKNIMIPFGCDFRFMNADINFKNMDKLMKYINSKPGKDNFASLPFCCILPVANND